MRIPIAAYYAVTISFLTLIVWLIAMSGAAPFFAVIAIIVTAEQWLPYPFDQWLITPWGMGLMAACCFLAGASLT